MSNVDCRISFEKYLESNRVLMQKLGYKKKTILEYFINPLKNNLLLRHRPRR